MYLKAYVVFLLINVVSVRSAQLISGLSGRSPLVRALKYWKTTEKLLLSACLYTEWQLKFHFAANE